MANLERVKNALLTVSKNVGHYEAFRKTDKYIVWAEDAEASCVSADNKKELQFIQGTIDYFSTEENDANVLKIKQALNDNEISFRLNSVQYEAETGYIHHEWVFEVD